DGRRGPRPEARRDEKRKGEKADRRGLTSHGAPRRGGPDAPPGGLFLDHLLPALQVEVPHRAVEIDRRFFDALEELIVEGTIVHRLADLHPQLIEEERNEVVERIHGAVHAPADAVADGHRPEEREHQIRAGPYPPDAHGLAEISPTRLDVAVLRGIEEPAEAEGAVDHEP